jgi:hypothetical protein
MQLGRTAWTLLGLARGALGPHHCDGHATVAGVGDGVGCAAKAPRRLSIPNSNQEVTAIHDRLASGEVRFRGGLHKRQPFNAAGRGDQLVVAVLLFWLEAIPVVLGGHHDLEDAPEVQHGAGEELVRAAGQA